MKSFLPGSSTISRIRSFQFVDLVIDVILVRSRTGVFPEKPDQVRPAEARGLCRSDDAERFHPVALYIFPGSLHLSAPADKFPVHRDREGCQLMHMLFSGWYSIVAVFPPDSCITGFYGFTGFYDRTVLYNYTSCN